MIIGYMRVSTEDQKHDIQEDALLKEGCEKIYSDKISGKTTSRAGLDLCLAELSEGDTLVVWKLDRLGRKASYLFDMVSALQEQGISFKSVMENFDTGTTMGWAMFQMMGVFAELERNTIRDRVQAGVDAAISRGVKFGRPPMNEGTKGRVIRLRKQGLTMDKIVAQVGVSKGYVVKTCKEACNG